MRLMITKAMCLAVLVSIGSIANAISINDIPDWDATTAYKRGQLIQHEGAVKIAVLPSKNKPTSKHLFWRTVKVSNPKPFKARKLYLLGRTIESEGNVYVAKRISVPRDETALLNEKKWIHITENETGPELPDYTEEEALATLIGVDNNANNIRDDYETDIILSDLPADVKENALNSGKAYGEIIRVATTETEMTQADARLALQKLIYAKQCKSQSKALNSGRGWRETDFYNTVDRIEAKFKLQKTLYDFVADDSSFELNNESPCDMLKSI